MKYLFVVLFFALFICQKDAFSQQLSGFKKEWKNVETLEKQGLYRQALDQVNVIYKDAISHHNDQQQIKALIYQLKYRERIEENATVSNISEVDSLVEKSQGIPKAILQSMLAEMYYWYVQPRRYQLYDRITSLSEKENDITTWSLSHFYNRIAALYKSSLQDADALKQIQLKSLNVIIDTGKNSLSLQPTLFDLLAHRALGYFSGEEQYFLQPAEHFIIDQPVAFADPAQFIKANFQSSDSSSLHSYVYALQLYQQLMAFHLRDKNPAPLMDVSIARLRYVYLKAIMADKDSLYTSALERIIHDHSENAAVTMASYLLANYYLQKGNLYDLFTHPENRYDLKKALDICNSVSEKPATLGSFMCQRLKSEIRNQSILIEAEQVNVPHKPFRVLVKYKNTSHLYFRLVKLSDDPKTVFEKGYLDNKYVLSLLVYRQWEQTFPDPKDYQSHAAEMKVNALPVGRYALIVSANKNFSKGKMPVESVRFFVSNISYIHNNDGGFLVLNRETGMPLSGAKITLWKASYNVTTRRNELEKAGDYTANRQGFFQVKAIKDYPGLMPEIKVDGDHLFIGQPQYIPYISSENKVKDTLIEKTYLFTDRSIYRPGQTIYFKAITFNPSSHESKVIENKKLTVYLYDVNNQKVDSLQLITNDFGSVAGSFILPTGLLNGQMHLEVKDQNVYNYFSVEDYKRPTFFLQWDTTARQYRLGDNVSVKGSAIAYSQAVVDGAIVKYQVTRNTQTRFPFPPFGRMFTIALPSARQATITQGESKTDDKGNFEINFPAIPDESVDSSQHPVFIYAVSVDVTDINGESHHSNYELPLGYTSLQLQIDGADKVNLLKSDTIHISSTNLSGKFIPSDVSINFYPLQSPDRFIRNRYWQQPDEFILNKKEYLKYFPHDEYKDESNPASWEKFPAVLNLHQTVSENTAVILPVQKLKPGWYAIEAIGKDEHGKSVSATKYIQLYNPDNKRPVFHEPLWISTNERTAQPREKVSWFLSSGQQAHIIAQDESLGTEGKISDVSLNNELMPQSISISDNDRGGIIRHYLTVKDNRLFTQDVVVHVPWKNKQLHIQYETFRDKLLPGSKEQWKMKITGEGGQKVSAELLASMYDMSLDAFRPHQWQLPDIYPSVNGKISWTSINNFSETPSNNIFPQEPFSYLGYEKIYPSLKWFGYSPGRIHFPRVLSYSVSSAPSSSIMEKRIAGIPEDTTAGNSLQSELQNISPRTNFNETAFFFPQLHTDDSGNAIFSFTMPEALTQWKLMMFADTKDMQFAYSDKETVTQKPLMIQANAPRFVRQGDQLIFSTKISNLSKEDLQGNAQLELMDAVTGKQVNGLFKNINTTQSFQVKAGQSSAVKWNMAVPENYTGVLEYKVVAAAGNFSDGEQNALPVLTNKTLITESLPLNFRGNGDYHLNWNILKNINSSSSQPLGLTIEYTGNPVWYAAQALPFLDENNQQSTDVLYNRFYANALSSVIANNIPDFKNIMDTWLTKDTNALKSPLQQNENLKTVLLQETPWVQAAQSENAQKHRVAEWFESKDFNAKMQDAVNKLQQLQLSNGGFSWFKNMPDSRYITQQIMTGIGHLKQLNAWPEEETSSLNQMVQKAIPYLDARMKEDYNQLLKSKLKALQIGDMEIQYLYMRSFFPDIKMADSVKPAYDFFQNLAAKQWLNKSPYMQAMTALALFHSGNVTEAKSILKSLSEAAINDRVKGMYWKNNQYGYLWNQAPLEAQAICIEAFNEINHDTKTVNDLCTWLLTQKQTQHWATNRATADAIYALLIAGKPYTSSTPSITIKTGDKTFDLNNKNSEAGTQYKEEFIPGKKITADMSKLNVRIKNAAKGEPTWGALYFQYFQNMNMVKNSNSPLSIERQISIEKNTANGQELIPVSKTTELKIGDKVQIRLVVKVNENMDYVHLKDVRASCMEPLQTLSGYHWQNGTGYYFTVTDAAVHYYFPHLNKGTYVFTYPVYITHAGDYSGGLSTLECLYAPVFSAHSEGTKINVK